MHPLEIIENTLYKTHPWAKGRAILLCYAGSHAYGTATPTSDIDLRGILIPPKEYTLGLKSFESYHSPEGGEYDIVIYSLKKYLQLAIQNNPNILEMAWADEETIIYCNDLGRSLIAMRDSFMSKRIFTTFSGYAYAQLHRMVEREGKPNHGAGNKERQAIREELGFDPKNMLHLIRIMRMGKEALETGRLIVRRPDREYLLSVKRGEIPIEEAIVEHDRLYEAMILFKETSLLPDEPDIQKIDDFLIKATHQVNVLEEQSLYDLQNCDIYNSGGN